MPVTFTNNFKNILDKLQSVLRTEFGNALPVYVGEENVKAGSQYLRLEPVGSELIEYASSSETREFTIDVFLYISDKSESRNKLDSILRLTSRIEALIHDNMIMTLTDSTRLYNCRLESTNIDNDDNFSSVSFLYKAEHTGNFN